MKRRFVEVVGGVAFIAAAVALSRIVAGEWNEGALNGAMLVLGVPFVVYWWVRDRPGRQHRRGKTDSDGDGGERTFSAK
jgi:hypothetical protein